MPVNYKELALRMEEDAFHIKGCLISVLVEDIADERFWECLIEFVKPELRNKIDFPVSLDPKNTRGTSVLKKYQKFVKEKFIICVDSDSEYLYNGDVWYRSDFIFDTIVYSRENFQCHHVVLDEIFKDLRITYKFESLFEEISKTIIDVFYFWLYFKETKTPNYVDNDVFETILDFDETDFNRIDDEYKIITTVKEKASKILESLKVKMDESWYDATLQNDIPNIKKRLKKQFIREEDILLFCYGHALMDKFVEPLLTELLKNEKIEEVKEELDNLSGEKLRNKVSEIEKKSKLIIKTKLEDSFKYLIYNSQYSSEMQAIKDRLESQLS